MADKTPSGKQNREGLLGSEAPGRQSGSHGLLYGLCRVCQSPHRRDYERKMAEGWSGRRLERYSKEIGETISVSSFLNHRDKHFKGEPEKLRDERMEEIARNRLRLGMEAIDVLKSNLEVMNKGKEALAKVFANPEGLSGTMMGNAARLMGEIASRIQSRAIRKAPAKTSTLRRAIGARRIRKAQLWEVAAKTRYARYVELYLGRGRRTPVRMGKTSFMEPAVRETEIEIDRILEVAGSKIVKR